MFFSFSLITNVRPSVCQVFGETRFSLLMDVFILVFMLFLSVHYQQILENIIFKLLTCFILLHRNFRFVSILGIGLKRPAFLVCLFFTSGLPQGIAPTSSAVVFDYACYILLHEQANIDY